MLDRFLSFLGFVPGLSGLSGLSGGGSSDDGFEAEGEAQVAFRSGAKLAATDEEETPDERRGRITDRDLVWPGKTETIHLHNPEPTALRFELTVTDLDSAFYIRRPAVGGTTPREGGVLLQPGQDAAFDVVFVPPPGGIKTRSKTFSFVLTCFDPRRSADPGEIVQDLPLRWVALPSPSDFTLTALPPFVVTRPWRRDARFAVKLTNKSFLPPAVGLSILRATTKDGLDRTSDTVGTVEQALAARTPGVWQMVLPPLPRRGSYYTAVRGTAQTADAHSVPLMLPRPVIVRYVPWLRMGRDWLFLLGVLLFLFWLAWGVPVRKTPIIRVSLAFAGLDKGQIPTDSRLEDLTAQMILTDERGHDLEEEKPMPGAVLGNAFEFTAPPRWYGYRWAFGSHIGWNGFSQVPQHFRISIAPAESEKAAFKRFDLNTLLPDGTPAYKIETAASPYGTWVTPATYVVQSAHGVFVNLRLGALGALNGKNLSRVSVSYRLDGEEQAPRTFQLLHDGAGNLRPLTLDLTDTVPLGSSRQFAAKVTAEGLSSNEGEALQVRRQDGPFSMTLSFPKSYPKPPVSPHPPTQVTPPTQGTPPVPGTPPTPGNPPTPGTSPTPGTLPTQGTPPIQGTPLTQGTPPIQRTPTHPPVAGPLPHPNHVPISTPVPVGLPPHRPIGPVLPPPTAPGLNVPRLSVSPPTFLLAPVGLTAQATGTAQIAVHWNSVAGARKYILYRRAEAGQHLSRKNGQGLTAVILAGKTSYLDTGLVPGTLYLYRIQAKSGKLSSPLSGEALTLTRLAAQARSARHPHSAPHSAPQAPVTVALAVNPDGHDMEATLDFVNTSSHPVYLDNVSACSDGKVGDGVFLVAVDGHPVPFSGRKTPRPAVPGPRQYMPLLAGEAKRMVVSLGNSYRLSSGTHTYTITYTAAHNYPAIFQTMTLRSAPAQCVLTR